MELPGDVAQILVVDWVSEVPRFELLNVADVALSKSEIRIVLLTLHLDGLNRVVTKILLLVELLEEVGEVMRLLHLIFLDLLDLGTVEFIFEFGISKVL